VNLLVIVALQLMLAAMLPLHSPLHAQGAAAAPQRTPAAPQLPLPVAERTVSGRVVRPLAKDLEPMRGLRVTLHRVAPDGQGPMDSVLTDAQGRYSFRYLPHGSDQAIYFVSAMHAGIAYFTPALKAANVTGPDAEIVVFDTTSRGVPLLVRGRHLIVSAPDSQQMRTVIEVYEISNDTSVTLIAPEGTSRPAFTATLPKGARDPKLGQGDVPADAVSFTNGQMRVFAPFAPGVKQLSFSYLLPNDAFPLDLKLGQPATVLEVLLEDAAGRATGGRLVGVDPVTVDERRFQRFLTQDVKGDVVVHIDLPRVAGPARNRYVVAVLLSVGVALLFGLARAVRQRPIVSEGPAFAFPETGEERDRLAREIGDLDEAWTAQHEPTDEMRSAYEQRRNDLKTLLAAELARAPRRG
jgi:hypothetical protein